MFTCPVCGYDKLARPPDNFAICPSCGTEFGYDDTTKTYSQLRDEWILSGLNWFDEPAPHGWNGLDQLFKFGYSFSAPSWMIRAEVNFPSRRVRDSVASKANARMFVDRFQVSYQQ